MALVPLLALVWAQPAAAQAQEDPEEVIAWLNSAIDEARWKLEFYCTCRFRAAWGESQEAALANLKKATVVHGVLARKGDLFRASGRSPGTDNWPANFECVESPTLQLNWYAARNGQGQSLEREPVRISRTPRAQAGLERLLYTCPTFHLDPVSESGWKTGQVISPPEPTEGAAVRVVNTVERPNADHLVVVTEVRRNDTLTLRRRATFSTRYRPPALVRLETFSDQRSAGAKFASNSVLVAEGFVEVQGGWLPSRMLLTGGPFVLNQTEPPQYLASEWVSDDLGKRPPTAEDFVVTIPEQVDVQGLKQPPALGSVRRLDISALTVDDLEVPVPQPGAPSAPRRVLQHKPPMPSKLRVWLTLLGLLALSASVIWVWRVRSRKRIP